MFWPRRVWLAPSPIVTAPMFPPSSITPAKSPPTPLMVRVWLTMLTWEVAAVEAEALRGPMNSFSSTVSWPVPLRVTLLEPAIVWPPALSSSSVEAFSTVVEPLKVLTPVSVQVPLTSIPLVAEVLVMAPANTPVAPVRVRTPLPSWMPLLEDALLTVFTLSALSPTDRAPVPRIVMALAVSAAPPEALSSSSNEPVWTVVVPV